MHLSVSEAVVAMLLAEPLSPLTESPNSWHDVTLSFLRVAIEVSYHGRPLKTSNSHPSDKRPSLLYCKYSNIVIGLISVVATANNHNVINNCNNVCLPVSVPRNGSYLAL